MTELKKGSYQYFVDLGDRLEIAISKTVYVDEASQLIWFSSIPRPNRDFFYQDTEAEVDKSKMVYGPTTGPSEEEADEEDTTGVPTRVAKAGHRVSTTFVVNSPPDFRVPYKPFYTAEELKSFRNLGLDPGMIRILFLLCLHFSHLRNYRH